MNKVFKRKIKNNPDLTPFQKKVLIKTLDIPKGKVRTYAQVAKSINTKAYRAVGNALKNNPYAPRVPCHRVVNSDGSLGGYKGKRRNSEKQRLLQQEGVEIKKGKVELSRYLFGF